MISYSNKSRIDSPRLRGFDYSSNGCYFVTICTKDKFEDFGEIAGDKGKVKVKLSEIGKMTDRYWLEIPRHFPFVELDEYIIMPNHVHGIIVIDNNQNFLNSGELF